MLKALIQQKYEFNEDEDLINFGAYGQVFKIKDKKVNTEYVLKKLLKSAPNNQNNGTDVESFDKEIDNLKRLKGNNIINIIDYYSDKKDKFFYIILEKMDGDLNQMLKEKNNKMSSNMIRKIFKQLNSALNIMIKEKRCHRDLKPENILYSYTNNDKSDFIIKLGDFGLATDLYLTRSTNAGTPIFKAPEIGFKNYYADKCDLYSIGVILYMLKTGEIIFKGNNLEDIITNKKFGNLKKTKNNKIIEDDDNLNDLINKLVVNDPNERLNWNDYFNHPFFKENEEIQKEKSKEINEKLNNEIKRLKNENIQLQNKLKNVENELNEIKQKLKLKINENETKIKEKEKLKSNENKTKINEKEKLVNENKKIETNEKEKLELNDKLYENIIEIEINSNNKNNEKIKIINDNFFKKENTILFINKNKKEFDNYIKIDNNINNKIIILNNDKLESLKKMFYNCENISKIKFIKLNTINVKDMKDMFDGCYELTSIDVSNFKTDNVKDMSYMFCNCYKLTSIDVNNNNEKIFKKFINEKQTKINKK